MDSSACPPQTWLELEGKLELIIRADARFMLGFLCSILCCLPRMIFGWVLRLLSLLIWNIYLVLGCFSSGHQSSVSVLLHQGSAPSGTARRESQLAKYTRNHWPCRHRNHIFGTQDHAVKPEAGNLDWGICTPISLQHAISSIKSRPKTSDFFKWGRYRLDKGSSKSSLSIAGPVSKNDEDATFDKEADTTVRLKRSRRFSKRGSDGTLQPSASPPRGPGLCNHHEAPCDNNRATGPPEAPLSSYATPPPLALPVGRVARDANFEAAIPHSTRARLLTVDGGVKTSSKDCKCLQGQRNEALSRAVLVHPDQREAPSSLPWAVPKPVGKKYTTAIHFSKALNDSSPTWRSIPGARQVAGGSSSNGKGKAKAWSNTTGARGSSAQNTANSHTWDRSTANGEDGEGEGDDDDNDDEDDDQSEPDLPTDQEASNPSTSGKVFRCPIYAADPSLCDNPRCSRWYAPKIQAVTRHIKKSHPRIEEDKKKTIETWQKRRLKPEERWREYYRLFGGDDPSSVCPYTVETNAPNPVATALAQAVNDIKQYLSPPMPTSSHETLRSFLRLYAEKADRDSQARIGFHSQEAKIHRRFEQRLRQSREVFADAVETLLTSPAVSSSRWGATGHASPEGATMANASQDEVLLEITGNSGRRQSTYATDIGNDESGLAAPTSTSTNMPQQDPAYLMVPTGMMRTPSSSQQQHHHRRRRQHQHQHPHQHQHEFGRGGIPPPQMGTNMSVLGTGIYQRQESINEVLSETDRVLHAQTAAAAAASSSSSSSPPPTKRARFHVHQQQHQQQQHQQQQVELQQASWDDPAAFAFGFTSTPYQSFPGSNFQGPSSPSPSLNSGCQCWMPSASMRLYCSRCQSDSPHGTCYCQQQQGMNVLRCMICRLKAS
ncbi:hypothetical protein PV08_04052 [Exophiala spinifera]|uniref:Uncharacterized protein n=1 Tax=Exophiala spinifera TaxID=91928 RepID=A0A0D1ZVY6_9EURO|nr:uncharacterized protein PV08_04052 [Exophiala spinifera]KIW16862.1 hypothetical protein PV08_04052 [Exophiala spinifera]